MHAALLEVYWKLLVALVRAELVAQVRKPTISTSRRELVAACDSTSSNDRAYLALFEALGGCDPCQNRMAAKCVKNTDYDADTR